MLEDRIESEIQVLTEEMLNKADKKPSLKTNKRRSDEINISCVHINGHPTNRINADEIEEEMAESQLKCIGKIAGPSHCSENDCNCCFNIAAQMII